MAQNTNAVSNNTGIVRYGPINIDLLDSTQANSPIGTFQNDQLFVHVIDAVVVGVNVKGTLSVTPIVILNNGTTGQNISSSTTLTSIAAKTYTKLAIPANAVVCGGDAATDFINLYASTLGVGQATTYRARANNEATITTAATHGFAVGDVIDVLDCTDATFNAKQVSVVSVPTTTTFTYLNAGANVGSTADTAGRVGACNVECYVWAQQLN